MSVKREYVFPPQLLATPLVAPSQMYNLSTPGDHYRKFRKSMFLNAVWLRACTSSLQKSSAECRLLLVLAPVRSGLSGLS